MQSISLVKSVILITPLDNQGDTFRFQLISSYVLHITDVYLTKRLCRDLAQRQATTEHTLALFRELQLWRQRRLEFSSKTG